MSHLSKRIIAVAVLAAVSHIPVAYSYDTFTSGGVIVQYNSSGFPNYGFYDLRNTATGREWYLIADWLDWGAPAGAVSIGHTRTANPFIIEGNAPTYLLYLDSQSRVGINTNTPAVDLHVVGDGAGTVDEVLRLESSKPPQQVFRNSGTGATWFFAMTGDDQFKVSFDGTGKVEARFQQNGNLAIAGALTQNSDVNSKRNIHEVNAKEILKKVTELPISTWEYKEEQGVTHLGPMAQDFHAVFGLGSAPEGISSIDTGGVALAAVKGLNEVLNESNRELERLVREKDEQLAALAKELVNQSEELAKQSEELANQTERQDRELADLKAAHAELKAFLYALSLDKTVAMVE